MGLLTRFVLLVQVLLLVCSTQLLAEQSTEQSVPIWSWVLENEELYVFRFDQDDLNWRQIRTERDQRKEIHEQPKHLGLVRGSKGRLFAKFTRDGSPLPAGTLLVKDPDGHTRTTQVAPQMEEMILPENQMLNGRYLVGGHFVTHTRTDDGADQEVHLYPKTLVGHRKSGGRPGSFPAFFFNDDAIPLEIGSALSPARRRMGGGYQRPHESYDMEVRYKGKPLPDATVEVFAESSKWHRIYRTDAAGRFAVTPFDDRSRQRHYDKLLYVVQVQDAPNHILHVATLPVIIFRNRPEWTSHLWGYGFWVIAGLLGICLLVGGNIYRHHRQRQDVLIRFDQCRVKED
jgi:hypothetical protein